MNIKKFIIVKKTEFLINILSSKTNFLVSFVQIKSNKLN